MLADGIYVGLPMQDYRDDPALGSSDLKDILANAVQWHARERNTAWRELNPPSDDETLATRFGTALHTMVLEPDEFDARYYLSTELPDLPNTKDEINAALIERGRPPVPTSRKKIEFEAAARMAGVQLLDDWKSQESILAGERERISPAWDRTLRIFRQVLDAHPTAMKFLRNGRSEVSVFWTDENGLRLKCRFDYMRVRTCADVKSYRLRAGEEPIQNFVAAVETFGYDFAAAHYMDCRMQAVPRLVAAGAMFNALGMPAKLDDREFFERVAAEPEPSWHWIACMTMGFPEVDAVHFPTSLMQFASAQVQVALAKQTYADFRERFGDDGSNAWVSSRRMVSLTDYNFMSPRSRDRGNIRWEHMDG